MTKFTDHIKTIAAKFDGNTEFNTFIDGTIDSYTDILDLCHEHGIATSTVTVSDVPSDEDGRRELHIDVVFDDEMQDFQHSFAAFSFYLDMSQTCIICFVFECHTDRWKCEGIDWKYILKIDPRLDLQGT